MVFNPKYLSIGFLLLFLNLRKLPIKDGLIIFLSASYIAVILGTIAVEEGMLDYPVRHLRDHFDSSLLFEMLYLPVFYLYFYRTTLYSRTFKL
ncbi:CBO0543 family protein [Oceanobacillus rekensis]|uniref:CBO0543 family protein n=1 Tax=Oceanobacillus rekensis TaxID=937927 RepID=UPI003CCC2652